LETDGKNLGDALRSAYSVSLVSGRGPDRAWLPDSSAAALEAVPQTLVRRELQRHTGKTVE